MKDFFLHLGERIVSLKNEIFNRNKNNPNELRTIRILKSNLNIAKNKKINNYASNSIKTSRVMFLNVILRFVLFLTFLFILIFLIKLKYNILNFIPKNLFEQFTRLANFFFLVSIIINVIF